MNRAVETIEQKKKENRNPILCEIILCGQF